MNQKRENNRFWTYCVTACFLASCYANVLVLQEYQNQKKEMNSLHKTIFNQMYTIDSLENEPCTFAIGTYYNPVTEQCDNRPLETADGTIIDIGKLNNHELRYISISRDLQKEFRLGDTVYIQCNNKSLTGIWVIRDLMNAKWEKKIDFLFPVKDTFNLTEPLPLKIKKYGKN